MAVAVPLVPNDVHPLDIVSEAFQPLKGLPPRRLARTVLVLTTDQRLILYQTDNLGVFIHIEDHDEICCEELSGALITQAAFCENAVYVITTDGSMYSRGLGGNTTALHLGRTCTFAPAKRFGRVPIDDFVLAIATGAGHVLAMTKSAVFGFGANYLGAIGLHSTVKYCEQPTKMYESSGDKAACQVAAGDDISMVLLRNGNVLACGNEDNMGTVKGSGCVFELTPIPGLIGKRVQQIGCTEKTSYALTNGVLHVMGYNYDGRAGLGHHKRVIREPTAITIDGNRKVRSFRCSRHMVLVELEPETIMYWGYLANGTVIKKPQRLEGFARPRDVFGEAHSQCTGGVVYIDKDPPITNEDSEPQMNQYQTESYQQEAKVLRASFENKPEKSTKVYQNIHAVEPEDIHSSYKQLRHDYGQLTKKYRAEQTQHERLLKRFEELLRDHKQLKTKCIALESTTDQLKTEKQQEIDLRVSQQNKFQKLAKQYEDMLLEHNQLLQDHKQLKTKCVALESTTDQLKTEKQQEIDLRVSQQTEYEQLAKQYEDMLLEHNQLRRDYSAQLFEKEKLNAKCAKLETDIRELDTKYSSSKAAGGSVCLEFAAVNMVAKEITTDWKMLGRFLGLEHCAIEEIDRYGYAKYKEKAHHVLRKWQKRSGENATKEVLIEALEDVQRKDIADDLRNM